MSGRKERARGATSAKTENSGGLYRQKCKNREKEREKNNIMRERKKGE
jgi:hypothetical protein